LREKRRKEPDYRKNEPQKHNQIDYTEKVKTDRVVNVANNQVEKNNNSFNNSTDEQRATENKKPYNKRRHRTSYINLLRISCEDRKTHSATSFTQTLGIKTTYLLLSSMLVSTVKSLSTI
jgi:hypothetical protein